ncbi:hypothetical protein [Streptomyces sp. NBC_01334]|uniref:hypothetical protein n=1 Tax=Streptomyces sp. NBC_01334 TaxID=2903827 RepID=UPI002E0E6F36|nr:hypothetical protein OG736_05180 [Streptomyces sp. NBC_01334]
MFRLAGARRPGRTEVAAPMVLVQVPPRRMRDSPSLEPGHLVLPGRLTGAPFVDAGRHVEAPFGGLGAVSVTFV